MKDIDPLMVGQMLAKIEHLSEQLDRAEKRMETLATRLGDVEDRYKVGKAAAWGAIMVLAAAIYGVKDLFGRLFGALTP